jgi:antitoxin ParD1/3/4
MSTRSIVPTKHEKEDVDRLVKSDQHQNASEVPCEKLRLIDLREAARTGFTDLDEGRFVDVRDGGLEDFIAGLGREAETRLSGTSS